MGRPAKSTMPDGQPVTGARPRRPARRGARGGWRVRRAKAREGGDQHTAPLGVGAPVGPCRKGRQPPANRPEPTEAGPPESNRTLSRPARLSIGQTRQVATPSKNSRSLAIGHANVRSLLPKMDCVLQTVLQHDLDILCISETWLSDPAADKILIFPGYKLVRRDRPTRRFRNRVVGGGVAILYRDCLNCSVIPIICNSDDCESLWVSVSGGGRRSATVGVIYRPPSKQLSAGLNEIHDQLRAAVAIGKPVFCLGDFNIDLMRPLTTPVRNYMTVLNDLNLHQLVTTPTHLEPVPSLLDHIITNVNDLETAVFVPPVPIADHLTTIIRAPFFRLKSRRRSFKARSWRKIDWNALCLYLLLSDWDKFYQAEDIDKKLEEFMHIWSSAIDAHCPLRNVNPRRPRCPWLVDNHVLRSTMRERDQAFRVWRQTGTESSRTEYRRLRNKVKSDCAKSKREFLCESMVTDRASFWRGIREFALRPKNGDGGRSGVKEMPTDHADNFNHHFTSVGPKIAAGLAASSRGAQPIAPRPPCVTSTKLILQPVTLPMFSRALRELSSSKAVGLDGVPLHAIKNCFAVLGPHLLHLVNKSLSSGVFPQNWKIASVIPLHKSGPCDAPENFRPVSILSVLSKLCEKVVCNQLSEYLITHDLLAPSQYAYRPCHSTEDAVTDAVEWMTRRIDAGHVVAVTSLDLSKAFDSVDHDVLLTKLQWHGIDPRWFRSYLDGRRQVVKGGSLSLPLSHGVPQGSLVGPILFSIFTNDLATYIPHGHLISYADDTQLFDSDLPDHASLLKSRQEETIRAVHAYFTANSLQMNPAKTNLLLVGTPQNLKKVSSLQLNIPNHTLYPQPSIKMLGVTIDCTMSWEKHISSLVKKCNSVLFCLYKIRHHLTPATRKLLIQTHVFPHILYCLSVWGGASACHLSRIQKVINFAARIVSGAQRRDHISKVVESLGWLGITDLVRQRDCIRVHRALHDPRAPAAVRSLITPRASVSERPTRSSVTDALELPSYRLSLSRRAFSFRAASFWNRLPPAVRVSRSLSALKSHLEKS